jgi:hypothetical protein
MVIWLTLTQCFSAIFWDKAVEWGLQDGPDAVTEVGSAFWYGFAFGDLVFYVPLLAAGLNGYAMNKPWGRLTLAAALGVTVYWPIVCLAAVNKAREVQGWNLAGESVYWIILPLITFRVAWGIWRLAREQ